MGCPAAGVLEHTPQLRGTKLKPPPPAIVYWMRELVSRLSSSSTSLSFLPTRSRGTVGHGGREQPVVPSPQAASATAATIQATPVAITLIGLPPGLGGT